MRVVHDVPGKTDSALIKLSRFRATGLGCRCLRFLFVQTDATEAEDKKSHKAIMDDKSISVPGSIQVFRCPQVRVELVFVLALYFPLVGASCLFVRTIDYGVVLRRKER